MTASFLVYPYFAKLFFAAMIIIYLLILFCQFFEETPFRALRENYKTIKAMGLLSRTLFFKKMIYFSIPESFELTIQLVYV